MNQNEKDMIWVGGSIPFRDTNATYSTWPYETLPACPSDHEYSNFKTLEDVKNEYEKEDSCLPTRSPTSCYFDFDEKYNIFYRDQQDCVIWCLDENGVYLFDYGNEDEEENENELTKQRTYVAKSLGEFLWRIKIENRCWYKYRGFGVSLDERDLIYNRTVWNPRNDCEKYIDHYFNLYKKTREFLLASDLGCTEKNVDSYLAWYTYPGSVTDLGENIQLKLEYLKYFDQMAEEGVLEIGHGMFQGLYLAKHTEERLKELIAEGEEN